MAYHVILVRMPKSDLIPPTREVVHHIPDAKDELKQARRWAKNEGTKLLQPGDRLEWGRVVGGLTAKPVQSMTFVLDGNDEGDDETPPAVVVESATIPAVTA